MVCGEDYKEVLVWLFHKNLLSGNLRQAIQRLADQGDRGCLLLEDACTKTGMPVADVLQEKHQDIRSTHMGNTQCSSFDCMMRCQKQCLSTSWSIMSHWWRQNSLVPQVNLGQRPYISGTGCCCLADPQRISAFW